MFGACFVSFLILALHLKTKPKKGSELRILALGNEAHMLYGVLHFSFSRRQQKLPNELQKEIQNGAQIIQTRSKTRPENVSENDSPQKDQSIALGAILGPKREQILTKKQWKKRITEKNLKKGMLLIPAASL